ncbi:MAG: hypothetical protein LBN33_07705 [Desulfovibrio sp.]|nr:hypothetical protein [Desulfovibrio sp.]
MVVLYVTIVGSDARFFHQADIPPAVTAEPSVAALPVPELPAPAPQPVVAKRPEADAVKNRAEALRVTTQSEGDSKALVLDFDYVPAQAKGFAPAATKHYFMEGSPTFVLALGEHWIMDIEQKSYSTGLPQVGSVSVILSRSNNLRFLVHTRTMAQAIGARVKINPTATGLQAIIHVPQ